MTISNDITVICLIGSNSIISTKTELESNYGKARVCNSWPCNSNSVRSVLLRCCRRDCLYLLAGMELRVQLDAGPGGLRYRGAAEVDL